MRGTQASLTRGVHVEGSERGNPFHLRDWRLHSCNAAWGIRRPVGPRWIIGL